MFLYTYIYIFTHFSSASIVKFEQVNVSWEKDYADLFDPLQSTEKYTIKYLR